MVIGNIERRAEHLRVSISRETAIENGKYVLHQSLAMPHDHATAQCVQCSIRQLA